MSTSALQVEHEGYDRGLRIADCGLRIAGKTDVCH